MKAQGATAVDVTVPDLAALLAAGRPVVVTAAHVVAE
jgi:hypothetical protein